MPSRPSLQAWAKTVGPSPSTCSLNRMPGPSLASALASVPLRTSSGSRRRSSPFSSIRSKAYGNTVVSAVVLNDTERGNAFVVAGDSFAADDEGARAQALWRLDDQRKAAREVIAGTVVEPPPPVALAGDEAEAIVLDLV